MEHPLIFCLKSLSDRDLKFVNLQDEFFWLSERFGMIHVKGKHREMDVSENSGIPKSSILIRFSILNHPFWDTTIFGNTQMVIYKDYQPL